MPLGHSHDPSIPLDTSKVASHGAMTDQRLRGFLTMNWARDDLIGYAVFYACIDCLPCGDDSTIEVRWVSRHAPRPDKRGQIEWGKLLKQIHRRAKKVRGVDQDTPELILKDRREGLTITVLHAPGKELAALRLAHQAKDLLKKWYSLGYGSWPEPGDEYPEELEERVDEE